MLVKRGLEFFILKFMSPFIDTSKMHWVAVTLKGPGEFQNKISPSFLSQRS